MDRQEASRRAAQHALLAALRQVYPDPLLELRDRPAEPVPVSAPPTDEQPARSRERQEAIDRAIRRVQELAPGPDTPSDSGFDFDAWADRWHLHALRDLAPYLRRHWQKRPAAGARFEVIPRVIPQRRITLRITRTLDPDRETKKAFLASIIAEGEGFYDEQMKALPERPHHRRRELRQHAEWYVRKHVQGWTYDKIGDDAAKEGRRRRRQWKSDLEQNGDVDAADTIRKGIATFARLLDRK